MPRPQPNADERSVLDTRRGMLTLVLLCAVQFLDIIGAVFFSVTTAANAGVPADEAGLAAGLINTSQQLGSALGLAIFSAIATATTAGLLSAPGVDRLHAVTAGYRDALVACSIFLLAATGFALRTANSRGEVPRDDLAAPSTAGSLSIAERPG